MVYQIRTQKYWLENPDSWTGLSQTSNLRAQAFLPQSNEQYTTLLAAPLLQVGSERQPARRITLFYLCLFAILWVYCRGSSAIVKGHRLIEVVELCGIELGGHMMQR